MTGGPRRWREQRWPVGETIDRTVAGYDLRPRGEQMRLGT